MPLIEDPGRLIQPEDLPRDPATLHLPQPYVPGFGFYSRCWLPRAELAGLTPDEIEDAQHQMDKQLVELDPDDEDDQKTIEALLDREPSEIEAPYYNGAHPSWQVDGLRGDEDVHLTNLDDNGKTFFKLPGTLPYVRFRRGEGWEKVGVELDTLVIDREATKVFLVWRGNVAYGGLDELADYPVTDIDIQDMAVSEWQDKVHDEQIARARKDLTSIINIDELSKEEDAEFDKRVEQAGVGLGGVKENLSVDAREGKAADGALKDLDREDVILSDDAWVEEARLQGLSDEEIKKLQLEKDERAAVKHKKEELRKKMADIKKKKEEEAALEAEQKKKKKKKEESDQPPEDDDDDDEDDMIEASPLSDDDKGEEKKKAPSKQSKKKPGSKRSKKK